MNLEAKARVLDLLANFHVGQRYGTTGAMLALQAGISTRELRDCVTALREDGIGVCGTPETGYFVAETNHELEEFCIKFLRDRALHSLRLISRLTHTALPDLVGQLKLES